MKRSSAVCIAALALLAQAACASSIVTRPIKNAQSIKDPTRRQGVVYALPRTVLVLDMPLIEQQFKHGEFHDLIPYFFPGEKADSLATSYAIGDVIVSTRGEPDPDALYLVDVRGGLMEDRKLGVTLTELGVLSTINAEATHHGSEIFGQFVKSAAAIASTVAAAPRTEGRSVADKRRTVKGASGGCRPPDIELSGEEQAVFDRLSRADQDFYCGLRPGERASYAALDEFRRDGFRAYVGNPRTNQPKVAHFIAAAEAFAQIADIQARRLTVVTTTGSDDVNYLERVLKELSETESGLLSMFFGRTIKKTAWAGRFECVATRSTTALRVDMFRFSKAAGFCKLTPTTAQSQLVCEVNAVPPEPATCDGARTVALQVTGNVTGTAPIDSALSGATGERGLFYRVPGRATVEVTVSDPSTELHRSMVAMAQFGTVVSLPHTTGGRRTQYVAELYPASGSLKTFTMDSEAALQAGLVEQVGSGVDNVLKARQARAKAEAAADDELTELKYQRELAEERLKLKKAEDELHGGEEK